MAWRVDQASKVAAPLEAMAKPVHMSCLRRFAARNWSTLTVMGLPALRNAIGAGVVSGVIGKGASGRASVDSASGGVDASRGAAEVSKKVSGSVEMVAAGTAAGAPIAALSADKDIV